LHSDVVKIFIPHPSDPCQEKILYLQCGNPNLCARRAFKHEGYAQSISPCQKTRYPHRTELSHRWGARYPVIGR